MATGSLTPGQPGAAGSRGKAENVVGEELRRNRENPGLESSQGQDFRMGKGEPWLVSAVIVLSLAGGRKKSQRNLLQI